MSSYQRYAFPRERLGYTTKYRIVSAVWCMNHRQQHKETKMKNKNCENNQPRNIPLFIHNSDSDVLTQSSTLLTAARSVSPCLGPGMVSSLCQYCRAPMAKYQFPWDGVSSIKVEPKLGGLRPSPEKVPPVDVFGKAILNALNPVMFVSCTGFDDWIHSLQG